MKQFTCEPYSACREFADYVLANGRAHPMCPHLRTLKEDVTVLYSSGGAPRKFRAGSNMCLQQLETESKWECSLEGPLRYNHDGVLETVCARDKKILLSLIGMTEITAREKEIFLSQNPKRKGH